MRLDSIPIRRHFQQAQYGARGGATRETLAVLPQGPQGQFGGFGAMQAPAGRQVVEKKQNYYLHDERSTTERRRHTSNGS